MTKPESDLLNLSNRLQSDRCACGSTPLADYQPGSLMIQCPTCQLSFTAPDLEIETALKGWAEVTA